MFQSASSSYLHLFWGYAAFWLCIAGFVWCASSEQRKQRRELSALKAELSALRDKISAGSR